MALSSFDLTACGGDGRIDISSFLEAVDTLPPPETVIIEIAKVFVDGAVTVPDTLMAR